MPTDNGKLGKSRTEGNSDWTQLGKTAERREWGGTVRPLAREGQGEIVAERLIGRTTHFAHAAEWVRRHWEEIDGDRFREIGIREVQGWRLA